VHNIYTYIKIKIHCYNYQNNAEHRAFTTYLVLQSIAWQ